jgi:RHS repeat-associated protein
LIYSSGSTPNPFTWNGAFGYEWIEFTGLFHVGAREYDPRTARWLQRDPIGVGGGHPNVYLYCGNEPVNAKDPSGLDVGWAKRKIENNPYGKIKFLICIGDVSTGGPTNWFTDALLTKRIVQLISYLLLIEGLESSQIAVYFRCTDQELLQALPSATHLLFIGHGNEEYLTTCADTVVSVDTLKNTLNGRCLHEAVLLSCWSSLTPDFKNALVGNQGHFRGCSGPYNVWLDLDLGPVGSWFMERKGRR